MPNDPDYAPRINGETCEGQLELYGFTPECTPSIQSAERPLGSGLAVDRAWAVTTGHASVMIGLADDGLDLAHPDLAARIALNSGELPFPDVGRPTLRHDINLDGAFTVLDFTSATGTIAPRLEFVQDSRLLARPDRGDTNGNGILDPQDILRIFSDGRDGDRNGYTDDIAGWDFLQDDNDPTTASARGTAQALRVLATANNQVGGAGVCPNCSALPLRLSAEGLAGADRGALAIVYAAQRRAQIVHMGAALWGASPLLTRAVDLAFEGGTLIIAAAGTGSTHFANTAWPDNRVLVVGAIGHDKLAKSRATSQVFPDPCGRIGPSLHVVAPGRCDDGASALAAGVAGLALSASRKFGLSLQATEIWSLMQTTADDLQGPGRDPSTGWGRLNARAIIDAVVQGRQPATGIIAEPRFGAVLDPSNGEPGRVKIILSPTTQPEVRWTLEAAPGWAPKPSEFVEIESGRFESGGSREAQAELPLNRWHEDPTSPLQTELTLQVTFHVPMESVAPTVVQTHVHIHRDLQVMPAFPIQLRGGNIGGLRGFQPDLGQPARILVGTTAGHIHLIDGRGQLISEFSAKSPPSHWFGPQAHARIPAVLQGELQSVLEAPIVAPLSVARFDPDAPPLIVVSNADAEVLAFGPQGAVQAGFPVSIALGTARATAAPAGATAAVAMGGQGKTAALWASDARAFLVRINPDGSRQAQLELDGPPGAPALQSDGVVWAASPTSLYRFDADQTQPDETWPQHLHTTTRARGLAAGLLPAPVLTTVGNTTRALVAGWGGPLTGFDARGRAERFDVLAWSTSLAIADIDLDGQDDLLASTAPLNEIMGLGPAEAAVASPSAFGLVDGAGFEGFGIRTASAPFAPLVVDLGGDRAPEVVFGDDRGRVWAIGSDGRVAQGFPKVCGDPLFGAPAVADLDGDGRLELLAVTRRGRVWAWRLDTPTSAAVPWPGARGGPRSVGQASLSNSGPSAGSADGCRCLSSEPEPEHCIGLMFLLLLWPVSRRWVCANTPWG